MPLDLSSVETVEHSLSQSEPDVGRQDPDENVVYNDDSEMSSFSPLPEHNRHEVDAARDRLSQVQHSLQWPNIDNTPLSEFCTPYLASLACPSLFPDRKGDPTNPSIIRDVPFSDKIEHLIRFAEKENGKWVYHFASYPRFSYWALNMI